MTMAGAAELDMPVEVKKKPKGKAGGGKKDKAAGLKAPRLYAKVTSAPERGRLRRAGILCDMIEELKVLTVSCCVAYFRCSAGRAQAVSNQRDERMGVQRRGALQPPVPSGPAQCGARAAPSSEHDVVMLTGACMNSPHAQPLHIWMTLNCTITKHGLTASRRSHTTWTWTCPPTFR